MNCSDIGEALLHGAMSAPLPTEAQSHLDGCSACRELVRILREPVIQDSPPSTSLRALGRALSEDLHPVRPIVVSRVFSLLLAIFVAIVSFAGYRMGALALVARSPLQATAMLAALGIGACLLAHSLANLIVPGSRHRIRPEFLPVAIAIALAAAISVLFAFQHERNFWAQSFRCFRVGTPIAAFAAIPIYFVLRRGAVLAPPVTGAVAGLLAGLVGATALEIHCPNLDASHILVSHLGVAVFGALAGLAIGLVGDRSPGIWRREEPLYRRS